MDSGSEDTDLLEEAATCYDKSLLCANDVEELGERGVDRPWAVVHTLESVGVCVRACEVRGHGR